MIKKVLLVFVLSIFLNNVQVFSQNCPTYSNNVISSFFTCANQNYFFEVANTTCPGTITFSVNGSYGLGGGSWTITSNLTGNVVATQNGNNFFGGNFNTVTIGPLNPAIVGSVFTITIAGATNVIEVRQNGVVVASGAQIFQPNINISAATLTVTTPNGNVTNVVQNCRNFKVPLNLQSTNFCTTLQINLPWVITCNVTGATLSSGVHPMTLYPATPTSTNDLVNISWNANVCQWDVVGANDCNLSDIGSIFTISPDPFTIATNACSNSSQVFTINYSGIPNGPDCCSTAGPLVPINQNVSFTQGNAVPINSPFGGTNNSALITIPANGIGGQATSVNLNVSMAGYCFNPPGTGTNTAYWVTVYVDGIIIHDIQYTTGNSVNLNFTLANIPNGFDESSIVQVYIYPNAFNQGAINTTYNPNANCANLTDGHWNMSSFNVTLTASFTEEEQTAISCEYLTSSLSQTCCTPSSSTDVNENVCNGNTGSLQAWRTNLEQANTSCLVFSSVTPVAGSVLPDNIFPTGNNTTCQPLVQEVSAYAYCDVNNSGTINAGDTYTLLSTFTLTVNPSAPNLVETDGACDLAPTAEVFCNGSLILSEIGTAPIQTCGNSINTTNVSGTFSVNDIALALGNANTNCYSSLSYNATASCAQTPIEDGVFTLDILYCEGSTVDLLPNTSNNGIVGTWSPSIISNTSSQTYIFTPTNSVCSNPVSINVSIEEAPNAGLNGSLLICEEESFTEQDLFLALNGTPSFGGTWTPAISGGGTYTYTVQGNLLCANATAQVIVTENPLVNGTFNINNLYCEGATVDLLPTISNNGFEGTWNPNVINNTISQSYTFTPSIALCATQTFLDVVIVAAPNAGNDGDFSICEGTIFTEQQLFSALSNSPNIGGSWTPSITGPGTYTYTVIGNTPCANSSAEVTVSNFPSTIYSIEANPDTIVFLESSNLNIFGGETYVWSPIESSDASVTVSPSENTTYTVFATDEFGCTDELSITIYVSYPNTTIALPDAFTPNNDGNNDVFEVFNKQDFTKIEMRVYDRWGEIVHEGFDQNHGWNGTFKNKSMNSGMYVYYVFAETLSGQQIKVSSSVSLIR